MEHGTQRKISKATGWSESKVSRICSRVQIPTWADAKRLAAITGTSPYVWLEGTAEDLDAAIAENYKPTSMEAA